MSTTQHTHIRVLPAFVVALVLVGALFLCRLLQFCRQFRGLTRGPSSSHTHPSKHTNTSHLYFKIIINKYTDWPSCHTGCSLYFSPFYGNTLSLLIDQSRQILKKLPRFHSCSRSLGSVFLRVLSDCFESKSLPCV